MRITTRPQASSVCLQCQRAFSTARARQAVGPEHPRFIDIPEPPQQTSYRPEDIKGILPVPRRLFDGKRGLPGQRARSIELATKTKHLNKPHGEDSFDGWKKKVSEQRKQNLREGTSELRRRLNVSDAKRDELSNARAKARQEAVSRPEREDERLTTVSNNFDFDSLMRGEIHDPKAGKPVTGTSKWERKQEKIQRRQEDHLHTLFAKATKFIVSPEQLDDAIESAFGTDENPRKFGRSTGDGAYSRNEDSHNIWAYDAPEHVKAALARINAQSARDGIALPERGPEGAKIHGGATIDQVAAALTGGDLVPRVKVAEKASILYKGITSRQ